jgi:hypothetical protein
MARCAVPAQLAIPSNTEQYRAAAVDIELDRPHTVQHTTSKLLRYELYSSYEQLCVQLVTCLSLSVAYSATNSAKQSIPSNTEHTELCFDTDNTEHTDELMHAHTEFRHNALGIQPYFIVQNFLSLKVSRMLLSSTSACAN